MKPCKGVCVSAAAATLLVISCATMQTAGTTNTATAREESVSPEPATSTTKAITSYKRYKDMVDGIVLTMTAAPKATAKGRAFASPFSVKVTKSADGTPAENIKLTVRYPAAKADGELQYAETTVTTTASGTADFAPPVPQSALNGTFTAFPAGDMSDPNIAAAAQLASVTAAFQVRTDLLQAGGCIAIVDISANGTPITTRSDSSSLVLTEMMKKGFVRVGNIDFTREVVSGDRARVYAAAKPMIGGATAFLIYGTVRYEQPIEKTTGGYVCALAADITCLSMKDGSVLCRMTKTSRATDAKDSQALTKARADLARQITESVYYGL